MTRAVHCLVVTRIEGFARVVVAALRAHHLVRGTEIALALRLRVGLHDSLGPPLILDVPTMHLGSAYLLRGKDRVVLAQFATLVLLMRGERFVCHHP